MRAITGSLEAVVLIFACAIAAAPARANDSTAEVAIGGLTLTKSDAISMDSEDLYISRDHVRVKYRFTNTTDAPIDTLVAFPLADIPPELYFEDNAPAFTLNLNIKTSVDGQPFALELVEQAFLNGQDVSALLSALHIPLGGPLGPVLGGENFDAAIGRLPVAGRDRLVAGELISYFTGKDSGWRQEWTLRMTLTRHQTFPPRKTITFEHEYAPRAGVGASGPASALWFRAPGDPQVSADLTERRRKYCINDGWLLGFDKKVEKSKRNTFGGLTLGYVLRSGANWKGPIGDFRLVVDKGKPDSLVSFCAEGVKKISPTQFEVRHANFTPKEDLDILIIDFYRRP